MSGSYFLEQNKIPVENGYDVIVVGGGVAGVSAAIAARRNGCRVLLIEKSALLGGLATSGFIAYYLPLCDGKGNQVIGGIAEELLYLSIKYGLDTLAQEWRNGGRSKVKKERYQTLFSPYAFALALDELVEAEGVDLLFDTLFSKPVMNLNACEGILVETKAGRMGFKGKVVIDATGDADVMNRAGAACVVQQNWMSFWFYESNLDTMKGALNNGNISAGIKLRMLGADLEKLEESGPIKKYPSGTAKQITRYILDGRRLLRDELVPGNCKNRFFVLPGMAQLRTTRRIRGKYELTEKDVFKKFDDSIGCSGDWRKAGPVFEIPYRALISPDVRNIIAAGRIIGAAGDVWEVTRVIPAASMTGQAAGSAAALAVKNNQHPDEISCTTLQEILRKNGIRIHF